MSKVADSVIASPDWPIGVFDSGVGGLSIVREIRRILPCERVVYLADRAHCPYGTRSPAEITRLALAIGRFLIDQPVKLVVVACNTASVAALAALRAHFAVPFVGVVPGVKVAAALTRTGVVGVLATPTTFQGELFTRLVEDHATGVNVVPMVCPGLVELAEAGDVDGVEARRLIQGYVWPLLHAGADALVLGCTHYPFFRPLVEEIAGPGVAVVDTGPAIARQVERVLTARALRREMGTGSVSYFTTEREIEAFRSVVERLLGETSPEVAQAVLPIAPDGSDLAGGELLPPRQ